MVSRGNLKFSSEFMKTISTVEKVVTKIPEMTVVTVLPEAIVLTVVSVVTVVPQIRVATVVY